MAPILLDTNAYAAIKRGHPEAAEIARRVPLMALTPVVLGELPGGFAAGTKAQENRAELAAFLSSSRLAVLTVDQVTAEQCATVYACLRAAGTPIPTNDMWIASSALQHGLSLFTYDGHFTQVPGLKVVMSLSDLGSP